MRVFVSYSRKNSDWVYTFYDKLQLSPRYDGWIDRYIPIGHDWWQTILAEIEASDYFIIILTSDSVESKYCLGELNYAHKLGKSIFPIMLEECREPRVIKDNRIQYHRVNDTENFDAVIRAVDYGIDTSINAPTWDANSVVMRPPEPNLNPQELYEQAIAAILQYDYIAAEPRLKQVLQGNPSMLLQNLAQDRLTETLNFVPIQRDYLQIVSLANNPVTINDARKAWDWYIDKHDTDFDPQNLKSTLFSIVPKVNNAQIDPNHMNLKGRNLFEIPHHIFEMTNLTQLNLSDNNLTIIPPEIGNLTNLTHLVLSNNRIETLPEEINKLEKLSQLGLGGNNLTEVPKSVTNCNNLSQLILSKNKIHKLPTNIENLSNLSNLSLIDNKLTSIPSEIGKLKNLKALHLHNNLLELLPIEIGVLPILNSFVVAKGNPLSELPHDIVSEGDNAILDWLRKQAKLKGLI